MKWAIVGLENVWGFAINMHIYLKLKQTLYFKTIYIEIASWELLIKNERKEEDDVSHKIKSSSQLSRRFVMIGKYDIHSSRPLEEGS